MTKVQLRRILEDGLNRYQLLNKDVNEQDDYERRRQFFKWVSDELEKVGCFAEVVRPDATVSSDDHYEKLRVMMKQALTDGERMCIETQSIGHYEAANSTFVGLTMFASRLFLEGLLGDDSENVSGGDCDSAPEDNSCDFRDCNNY